MTTAGASASRAGRLRVTPRAVILAVIVMALLISMVVPFKAYLAQRSRLADMERQTQLLERQNEELRQRMDRLHDPAYLEQIARECLGMVRPGEIPFVVVPKGGAAAPIRC
jgi:cell division protein FtsB